MLSVPNCYQSWMIFYVIQGLECPLQNYTPHPFPTFLTLSILSSEPATCKINEATYYGKVIKCIIATHYNRSKHVDCVRSITHWVLPKIWSIFCLKWQFRIRWFCFIDFEYVQQMIAIIRYKLLFFVAIYANVYQSTVHSFTSQNCGVNDHPTSIGVTCNQQDKLLSCYWFYGTYLPN